MCVSTVYLKIGTIFFNSENIISGFIKYYIGYYYAKIFKTDLLDVPKTVNDIRKHMKTTCFK